MSSYKIKKTPGNHEWFVADRFGMFITFGLYALPARHEWVKDVENIPDEKYDLYFKHFNPDMLDMKDWARQAKAAGMKYAVLTAKHIDGFCLFDTKYTDYNSMNTPYGKDIVREYVDAFRAEGLKVGLYYALIDWHHPDFTIDYLHPKRRDPDAVEQNKSRDMKKYAQYMRDQVTELMTGYGKIDILWLDFSYARPENGLYFNGLPIPEGIGGKGKEDWESEKLVETVRKYQPHILINDRLEIDQDLVTPEQRLPTKWPTHNQTGEKVLWESCQNFSNSWGYYRDELSWKSPRVIIDNLINTVCLGGNLIMNVGPTGRGYFDYRAEEALKIYADFMKYNSRAIYGCTMAEPEFKEPRGCRLTQSMDGTRLYLFLMEYPYRSIEVENLGDKVEYAQFLHDASEILINNSPVKTMAHRNYSEREEVYNSCKFIIPDVRPNISVPVIEIFLRQSENDFRASALSKDIIADAQH
ncbi:MAG: alpha-L-fucosidase [Monoglobales bacterium]